MYFVKIFLTSSSSSSVIEYTGSGIFLNSFSSCLCSSACFAPGQDRHNIDSFHRNFVKQSKEIATGTFSSCKSIDVSRNSSELLIDQRHIQLGYDLNEACHKSLQYLKNKYYILSNNKVSGGMQDPL